MDSRRVSTRSSPVKVSLENGATLSIQNASGLLKAHAYNLAMTYWKESDILVGSCAICECRISYGFGCFIVPEHVLICENCYSLRKYITVQADASLLWRTGDNEPDVDVRAAALEIPRVSVEKSRLRAAYEVRDNIQKGRIEEYLWRDAQDALFSGCTIKSQWKLMRQSLRGRSDTVTGGIGRVNYSWSLTGANTRLEREGYMRKAAPTAVGRTRNRWFLLNQHKLMYYWKEKSFAVGQSDGQKGNIELCDVSRVYLDEAQKIPVIKVETPNRTYELFAADAETATSWARDIASMCIIDAVSRAVPSAERVKLFIECGGDPNVGMFFRDRSMKRSALACVAGRDGEHAWEAAKVLLKESGSNPSCLLRTTAFIPADPVPGSFVFWREKLRKNREKQGGVMMDDGKGKVRDPSAGRSTDAPDASDSGPSKEGSIIKSPEEKKKLAIDFLHRIVRVFEFCKLESSELDQIRGDDSGGWSLLHACVAFGQLDTLAHVIDDMGMDVNAVDVGLMKCSALHFAVDQGNVEACEFLLSRGALQNTVDALGETPLHTAFRYGNEKILKLLLFYDAERGTLMEDRNIELNVNIQDREGRTLLWCAILWGFQSGEWSYFSRLIEVYSARIDIFDRYGETPLHFMIRAFATFSSKEENNCDVKKFCSLFKAVMKYGENAEVAIRTKRETDDATPLHLAVSHSLLDVLKVLVEVNQLGLSVVDTKGNTPIHSAFISREMDIVYFFLECDPKWLPIRIRNKKKETLLHCAAAFGTPEIVGRLLDIGSDVCVWDSLGRTPIDIACRNERIGSMTEFAIRNAGVNCVCEDGYTPILRSVENGSHEVVRILLEKTNVDLQCVLLESRKSALHIAAEKNYRIDCGRILLKDGSLLIDGTNVPKIDVNCCDAYGNTPLHYAHANDNTEFVDLLLEYGACDGNEMLNNAGHSPSQTIISEMFCESDFSEEYRFVDINKQKERSRIFYNPFANKFTDDDDDRRRTTSSIQPLTGDYSPI